MRSHSTPPSFRPEAVPLIGHLPNNLHPQLNRNDRLTSADIRPRALQLTHPTLTDDMNAIAQTSLACDYAELRPAPLFTSARATTRTCGKYTYSKRDALTARNARLRRNPSSNKRPAFLRVYACATCCGWHLTHTQPLSA